MIYLDTSFLAPYYVNEATSNQVETVLLSLPVDQLAISDWTRVEFASMLARRLRMGELTQDLIDNIMQDFQEDVEESYLVFAVTPLHFERAIQFLLQGNTGLRAGDALHLAIASAYGVNRLLSLDRGLINAAQVLGINADSGGILN